MTLQNATCSYFSNNQCKSCTLIELPYPEQIKSKEQALHDAFKEAGVPLAGIKPSYLSKSLLGSRNKAKFLVSGSTSDPILGIVDNDLNVSDLSLCPLHLPQIADLTPMLKELIQTFQLSPYNIRNDTGELKAIIIRAAESTGDCLVRFVLRSKKLIQAVQNAAMELQAQSPQVRVVSANIHPIRQSIIEGPEEIIWSDEKYIEERFGNLRFSVSPQSFSQVTSNVAEELYTAATEIIKNHRPKYLLDLFCGSGMFSFFAAKFFEQGLGLELNPCAIADANRSTKWNKIQNLEFITQDVLSYLNTEKSLLPDFILTNPPRRGLGVEICTQLETLHPNVILYSSCNAESLAQDLKLLTSYKIHSVQIFDMFPLTKHFEVLVELQRG